MHIAEIQIKNFRIFTDLQLTLNSGLNLLVGENNSGKTALVDAIRLTLDTNSAEWTRVGDFDFFGDEDSFSICLKFDGITPAQSHVFVEHLTHEENEEGVRKSVLYVTLSAQRTDIVRRGTRFIRTEYRSGEASDGPSLEREIRDYLSSTYLKPLRDAEAELSSGRGSRLAQILSNSKHFDRAGDHFRELLEGLITASADAKNNQGLQRNREEIDKHVKNLTFSSDEFELSIQMLGSKEFDQLNAVEKERAFQEILQRLSLTLNEMKPLQGLGYSNVLFMATELILLEQESGDFPLLLIEEPEAHLHPQLQMKLLKFIRDEYSAPESPKLQTILTTHSPNLASKAPLESLILMAAGKAFPLRDSETLLEKDDYVFLEKFLDVTKSNLFFAKSILIVEGDGENILLPTIAQLLDRSLEDYGASIVNVGNTAYTRYAKIFLRKAVLDGLGENLPIRVGCLRDLDLWPEAADKTVYDGGFKEVKSRNKQYWLPRTTEADGEFGTDPALKKRNLETFKVLHGEARIDIHQPQNVRVFVSDEWTFEYCLIKSGLAEIIYGLVKEDDDPDFADLPDDNEKRPIEIYKRIETSSKKTELAYLLSQKLKAMFGAEGEGVDLKALLPAYIVSSIEYATEPFHDNPAVVAGEAVEAVPVDGQAPDA